MQHLEVSGAVRPIYGSLSVKRLMKVVLCFEVSMLFFFFNLGLLYKTCKCQMIRFSNVLRPLYFKVMERGAICRF